MAKSSFKSLLRDAIEAVKGSEVPVTAVEYDPRTKHLRVEFERAPAVTAAPVSIPVADLTSAAAPEAKPVKYLPGTTIPDDDSPVDAMEIAGARPTYGLNGGLG